MDCTWVTPMRRVALNEAQPPERLQPDRLPAAVAAGAPSMKRSLRRGCNGSQYYAGDDKVSWGLRERSAAQRAQRSQRSTSRLPHRWYASEKQARALPGVLRATGALASSDERTVGSHGPMQTDVGEPILVYRSERAHIAEQYRILLRVNDLFNLTHDTLVPWGL